MKKENKIEKKGKSDAWMGKPDDNGETMPHPAERVLMLLIDE